jgi:hypothetical protein
MRYPGYNPPNDEPEKDSPLDKGFKLFTFCVFLKRQRNSPLTTPGGRTTRRKKNITKHTAGTDKK